MPNGAPKYTFVIRKRTGTELWYFRHRGLPGKHRILGRPGDLGFHRRYTELLETAVGAQAEAEELADSKSMRWLVQEYRSSDEWEGLAESTKRSYSSGLDRLNAMAGDLPFAKLTRRGVLELRKKVKADVVASRLAAVRIREEKDAEAAAAGKTLKRKPPKATDGSRTADLFAAALSSMLSWAVEYEYLEENPAEGVKRLRKKKNVESRKPWTEEQIRIVLSKAPQWIRDGVTVGLYTGQRLGDSMCMGKKQCVLPIVRVVQQKTGHLVDIHAVGPMRELVNRRLEAGDAVDALVIRETGEAYSERLFSDHLRDYLDGLGFTDISFHGLRYAAAGTLNEAGCTVATIVSIIGHSTYQMALKYLKAREEAARAAVAMEEASANRSK